MKDSVLSLAGRMCARYSLWTPAVLLLSQVRPNAPSSRNVRGRITYAMMMARQKPRMRRILCRMIRRQLDVSAETDLWLALNAWRLGFYRLALAIYRRVARRYSDSPEAAVAARQREFAQSLLEGSLSTQLAADIEAMGTDDRPLVVVAVSGRYLDLFQLWKEQFDRHAAFRLLILAMDKDALRIAREGALDVIDISSHFGFDPRGVIEPYSKRHLWVLRVLILKLLAERQQPTISLDLDAVLVGDLAELLSLLPKADIVAQSDYSIPVDVARKLGFILCCGFMFINPAPHTLQFLSAYWERTILEQDDQTALNHLLAEAGIKNKLSATGYMSFECAGASWVCPDKKLVSRDVGYGSFIRHFQQTGESIDQLRGLLGLAAVPTETLALGEKA